MASKDQSELSLEGDIEAAKSIEAIIGAITDPKLAVKVLGAGFTHFITGQRRLSLAQAIEVLAKVGTPPAEFLEDTQLREAVREVEQAAEDPDLDEEAFEAMRRAFAAAAYPDERRTVLMSLRLLKAMDGIEVVTMMTAYRMNKEGNKLKTWAGGNPMSWVQLIADEGDIQFPGLVLNAEEALVNKNIIDARSGGGNIPVTPSYRLAPLGIQLCQLMEKGDEVLTRKH